MKLSTTWLSTLLFGLIGLGSLTSSGMPMQSAGTTPASWPKPVEDSEDYSLLLFDVLEYRASNSADWDIIGWYGGDTNRIWIKSEGAKQFAAPTAGDADFQILYGRLISPYYDLQFGARAEQQWGANGNSNRYFAVLGVEGLAPYYFELDAALFLSQSGELSSRITASEDFLFTQRLISQLRFETNWAAKRNDQFEVGSGINDMALGFRLRYEFWREFAPYIGFSLSKQFGESADFSRAAGRSTSESEATLGLRMLL